MIFDLELKYKDPRLVFIKEGDSIAKALCSLYYYAVDSPRHIPADFIEISTESTTSLNQSKIPIQEVVWENGGQDVGIFSVDSDKFLLTDVMKYSYKYSTKIPLFYNFSFSINSEENMSDNSVNIFRMSGEVLDPDLYMVKIKNRSITIYSNLIDEVLFVEYISDGTINRTMLKLKPVFEEVSWSFVISPDQPLQKYTYMQYEGTVMTSHTDQLYLMYRKDIGIVHPPMAEIHSPWYLLIDNVRFVVEKGLETFNYEVPEYYMQRINQIVGSRVFTEITCQVLNESFVKTQKGIGPKYINTVDIFVREAASQIILRAYTCNTGKVGQLYKDNIVWDKVTDFNYNGVFQLPDPIKDSEDVVSTFTIQDEWYELRLLDLNANDITARTTIGVYILPYQSGLVRTIFYSLIGVSDPTDPLTKIGLDGAGFNTREDYLAAVDAADGVHLAYVRVDKNKLNDITRLNDVRGYEEVLFDKQAISKYTKDVFIGDYEKTKINIPLQDTMVALVSDEIMKDEYTTEQTEAYKAFLQDTLNTNLAMSTKSIIKKEAVMEIPN